jgi:hypothetical protein
LNAAYHCLRVVKLRLRHLLELERGTRPPDVQQIPPATMEVFTQVNQLCREADSFLAEKAIATSPLLKVQMFEKGQALTEKLNSRLLQLNARREALTEQMKLLNLAWESAPPAGSPGRINVLPCTRLEHIYRELSFFTRWCEELQERVARISF